MAWITDRKKDQLYDQQEQARLLQLARSSVEHGISHGGALSVTMSDYSPHLKKPGAAFVTLEKHGQLRGCIGSVEAYRPLVEDVAENAWNAAFRDPRFGSVTHSELHQLHFDISVLTKPQSMQFDSEEDLKQQIVPWEDGLILRDGYHRGLFLPAVWEKLPDIDTFLSHLKQKAGLPSGYWSDKLQIERFYSFEFGDNV
ncbi:MAG: AmmeMemoRadiSam system protein A [Candidatus Marinimicrobia bacterium]|nr:AmmeMemoRadiSam system protein A [Candidatus Neomarinimicrobiota bacterium]